MEVERGRERGGREGEFCDEEFVVAVRIGPTRPQFILLLYSTWDLSWPARDSVVLPSSATHRELKNSPTSKYNTCTLLYTVYDSKIKHNTTQITSGHNG